MPHRDSLLILNLGLGRDSMAMLLLAIEGNLVVEGERVHVSDLDAVIFSDTGAEWDFTTALIPEVRRLAMEHGFRFLVLEKPPQGLWGPWLKTRELGDRSDPPWRPEGSDAWSIEQKARRGWYHRRAPIMADFGSKQTIALRQDASCTMNHKVGPIRRAMNDLAVERFGLTNRSWSYRVAKGEAPKHRVLIGIAADEASRAINTGRPRYEWALYPLVEMGISKADEAAILERHGFGHVLKSGCDLCPFQGAGWYWVLSERHPARFAAIVAYEEAAASRQSNLRILGKVALPEAVRAWRERNPEATHQAVLEKSYSRCTKGQYDDPTQLGLFEVAA